jgi:hypothetical protein
MPPMYNYALLLHNYAAAGRRFRSERRPGRVPAFSPAAGGTDMPEPSLRASMTAGATRQIGRKREIGDGL